MPKKKKIPAIIVDLDGTLADISVRGRHLQGRKKDWKSFYATIKTDTLHHWCREIIDALATKYKVLLVSGRVGSLKEETIEWLALHDVPYDTLFLRPEHDHRPDTILKKEIYEKHIQKKYDILFVLEDRKKVVEMWRSIGLLCLQCAEGDF